MKHSDTFCILPWTHVCVSTNSKVIPCCRFQFPKPSVPLSTLNEQGTQALNVPEYNDIRTKMLNGDKVDQCKKCYFEEQNNISSYRDYSNNNFIKKDDNIETNKFLEMRYLEISLDNICNLQCRMCSSRFSTKLILRDQELSKYSWNSENYAVYKKLEIDYSFLQKEDLSKLQEIKLLGGEPFMSPNFLTFIDFIIDNANPENITLFIATNGTHKLTDIFREKLKRFKLIKIRVSLDSYSKSNDYQRYGSSYKEIWNNMMEYINSLPNAEIGTHSVVSIYNANKLDDTINKINDNRVNCRLDFVRNQEMSLTFVPDDYKEWLLQQNTKNNYAKEYISNILSSSKPNLNIWNIFLKNTKIVDDLYGISLKDYNSELYDFLSSNYGYN